MRRLSQKISEMLGEYEDWNRSEVKKVFQRRGCDQWSHMLLLGQGR